MMKILAFSDSHMYLDYMIDCTRRIQPDALIHLGDYYADAVALSAEFPHIPMYAVPGNCDQYKPGVYPDPVRVVELDGLRFYLTHGHQHGVKYDLHKLKLDSRRADAAAVLFGHTHQQLREYEDGLWVINPGSCGAYSAGAALIEIDDNKISHCVLMTR